MALLPSVHLGSPGVDRWHFKAHPDVGEVRLTWRDPSGADRPIEVHAIPSHGAMSDWTPTEQTWLDTVLDGRFTHGDLGVLSSRWCYAIVPRDGGADAEGAGLSCATHTSVTVTGVPIVQVGRFDGRGSEFALAPNGFVHFRSTFPRDVDFRFGVDDAATRWPYLQPGPDDAWAGRRSHRFRIRFDLASRPSADVDLAIWLVDRHLTRAGSARIELNGRPCEQVYLGDEQQLRGTDVSLPGRGAGPAYIERTIARERFVPGENVLDIIKDRGSWIAYDAVGLFLPDERGVVAR